MVRRADIRDRLLMGLKGKKPSILLFRVSCSFVTEFREKYKSCAVLDFLIARFLLSKCGFFAMTRVLIVTNIRFSFASYMLEICQVQKHGSCPEACTI